MSGEERIGKAQHRDHAMNGIDNTAVIGLDIGTGGARAVAVALTGSVLGESESRFPSDATRVTGERVEQDPEVWRIAARQALRDLRDRWPTVTRCAGISVDATSGTFLLVDRHRRPLTAGIMYNDQRAADVTPQVAHELDPILAPFGIQIATSFALPKLVHLLGESPELRGTARRLVHQTDWIVSMLTGDDGVTDISTALKTGADPGQLTWPDAIGQLGVPTEWLPRLVLPGTVIGLVTPHAAEQTGVPAGTPVVAGCTDGTAGCLASGARATGDLNVTLGTTLVFKAIAPQPLLDPAGAIYNHRHPAGGFLPGAASSTGGDWIERHFRGADFSQLDRLAQQHLPTRQCAYPLVKTGERFPFVCPHALGFGLDAIDDPSIRFAAGMEGVALLERLGIARLEALGLAVGPTIYATGGGAASDTWLRIRASASRRSYEVPAHAGCAMGAAVLAAMPVTGSCQEAVTRIVRTARTIEPHSPWLAAYDDAFERLCEALQGRGYL